MPKNEGERFIKKHTENITLYTLGIPILIQKYAILYDTDFKKNLMQIRFRNISSNRIDSVVLLVKVTETENNKEEIRYCYKSLDAYSDCFFGENEAIYIDSNAINNVEFIIEKVIFGQGTTMLNNKVMKRVPSPDSLSLISGNIVAYESLIAEVSNCHNIKNLATVHEDLWYCVCGNIQQRTDKTCRKCNLLLENALLFQQDRVLKVQSQKLEEEKKSREEERKIIRKKILKVCAISGAGILAIYLVINLVQFTISKIELSRQYDAAVAALETNDFDEAKKQFKELKDYKDSEKIYNSIDDLKEEYLKNEAYHSAQKEIDNEDYDKAIELLSSISDFEDAADLIIECNYLKAIKTAEEGEYDAAIKTLKEIIGYKDAVSKIKEYSYAEAMVFYKKKNIKNYNLAIENFIELGNYKDSEEKLSSCYYQAALCLIELSNYDKAIEYLAKVDGKEKSLCKQKIEECKDLRKEKEQEEKYKDILEAAKVGSLNRAIKELESLPEDFKDVSKLKQDIAALMEHKFVGNWSSEDGENIVIKGFYEDGVFLFDVSIGSVKYYKCIINGGSIYLEPEKKAESSQNKKSKTSTGKIGSGTTTIINIENFQDTYKNSNINTGYDVRYEEELTVTSPGVMNRIIKYYHYKNSDDKNPTVKIESQTYKK